MFDHKDTLEELNKNLPLGEKLSSVHKTIQKQFGFVDRIAVAIYDHKTDMIKTYLHSSNEQQPFHHYQTSLADSSSLMEIVKQRKPRVVNDLEIFSKGRLLPLSNCKTSSLSAARAINQTVLKGYSLK